MKVRQEPSPSSEIIVEPCIWVPFCVDTGMVEWGGRSGVRMLWNGLAFGGRELCGPSQEPWLASQGQWWWFTNRVLPCPGVRGSQAWRDGAGRNHKQGSRDSSEEFYQCLYCPVVFTEMPHRFCPGTSEHLDKFFAWVTDRFSRNSVILGLILPKRKSGNSEM